MRRTDPDAMAEAIAEAMRCLHEMVAAHDDRAIGVFDRLGGWFSRAYGVHVDHARFDELRREVFAAEIREVLGRIEQIARWQPALRPRASCWALDE